MASRLILKAIRLAKQGDAAAQLQLGQCYLSGGEGLAVNLPTAYRWLAAAADQGLAKAAWLIGEAIPPAAVDGPQRAKSYYETAAAQGSDAAATVLARWRLDGSLGPAAADDQALARQALRQAATAGHLAAQLELGGLAARGESLPDDLCWLERAAERGERSAMLQLVDYYWARADAEMWSPGQVPGKDRKRPPEDALTAARQALLWHTQAWAGQERYMSADEAWRRACLLLLDHQRQAGKWLEKAANANDRRAAYVLGLLYMGPSYVNGISGGGGTFWTLVSAQLQAGGALVAPGGGCQPPSTGSGLCLEPVKRHSWLYAA